MKTKPTFKLVIWFFAGLALAGETRAEGNFATPTELSAIVSPGKITLAWTDNALGEDNYKIEREVIGSGVVPGFSSYAIRAANTTSFEDTDLTPGFTYNYRVYAYAGALRSLASSEVSAMAIGDFATPAEFSAVVSPGKITLAWTDNAVGEDNYKIEREVIGAGVVPGFSSYAIRAANTASFVDTDLTPGFTYNYRVYAYAGALRSLASSEVSATAIGDFATPTELSAVVSPGKITLAWTDNALGEDNYKIEREVIGTGVVPGFSSYAIRAANSTGFVDIDLTPGFTYNYRVYAYAGALRSLASSEVSATAIGDSASIQVAIQPQGAVDAGAEWKIDNLDWQLSGATVSGLTLGFHQLLFRNPHGWSAPPSESVALTGAGVFRKDITFLRNHLTNPQRTGDAFSITVNGTNGQRFLIEKTTDWKTWTLVNVVIIQGETGVVSDKFEANGTQTFYRATPQ